MLLRRGQRDVVQAHRKQMDTRTQALLRQYAHRSGGHQNRPALREKHLRSLAFFRLANLS